MRQVNLQCYIREQLSYFKIRYEINKNSVSVKDMRFGDYLLWAISGGQAQTFQDKYKKIYFGDDEAIVNDRPR